MASENTSNTPRIGKIGIWSMEMRRGDAETTDAAAELDELGYGALWVPGAMGGELLRDISGLLAATKTMTVATGILNIWMHEVSDVGQWWHALPPAQRQRLLLGLGVSHGVMVGEAYKKPLSAMKAYLAKLAEEGLPPEQICLAALGPKMLELARDQTAGAHPYLVTPEHTASARQALGDGPFLAPEQGVVLEPNLARALDIARPYVKGYGQLANYANNWRRLGFSDEDIANTSDSLVDAVFACGDEQRIAERINAHFDAGADHVCLQVVGPNPTAPDFGALRQDWRKLAKALI